MVTTVRHCRRRPELVGCAGGLGVTGVSILEGRRLEEHDRGQIAGRQRLEEIVAVVLVIGGLGRGAIAPDALADGGERTRAGVG